MISPATGGSVTGAIGAFIALTCVFLFFSTAYMGLRVYYWKKKFVPIKVKGAQP